MHVEDMASACVKVLLELNINDMLSQRNGRTISFMNIGTGKDQTISDLVGIIKQITGFQGKINYDPSKPDGTYRKLLDVSKLTGMGFKPAFSLESGIVSVYEKYVSEQ
jgi:GDP-L-fucose synthase